MRATFMSRSLQQINKSRQQGKEVHEENLCALHVTVTLWL